MEDEDIFVVLFLVKVLLVVDGCLGIKVSIFFRIMVIGWLVMFQWMILMFMGIWVVEIRFSGLQNNK